MKYLIFVMCLSISALSFADDHYVYCKRLGEFGGPIVIFEYACPIGWIPA